MNLWLIEAIEVPVFGVVTGFLCALIAQYKRRSMHAGFIWGIAIGCAATTVRALALGPSWLSVAIGGAGLLALLMVAPRHPRLQVVFNTSKNSFWWVELAFVMFVGLAAVALLDGGLMSLRRTTAAPATITDQYPTIVSGGNDKTPQRLGHHYGYQFSVDGVVYSGSALRTWGSADGAVVCYDPSDPGNHNLVKSAQSCGGFDPFSPPG